MKKRLLVLLLLLLPVALAVGWWMRREPPPLPQPALSAASRRALLTQTRSALTALRDAGPQAVAPAAPTGEDLRPYCGRPTFIELYAVGRTGRLRLSASGGCPSDNLRQAIAAAAAEGRLGGPWLDLLDRTRIKIDLPGPEAPFPSKRLSNLQRRHYEPGLDGVILRRGGREAVHLPSDVLTLNLGDRKRRTIDKVLAHLERELGIAKGGWEADDAQLLRFRAESFVEASPGGEPLPIYRGVPPIREPYTPDYLEAGVRRWGDWLAAHIDAEGRFLYEYHPLQDRPSRDYNIVRHAGAVYGLLQLYHHTQDRQYLDAAKKSLAFVDRHLHRPSDYPALADHPRLQGVPDLVFYVEDPKNNQYPQANLGSAALALMAYVHLPKEERRPDQQQIVEGLAHFLRFLQVRADPKDGRFYTTFGQALDGKIPAQQAIYYPGEAFLAWMYLYREDPDADWLDAARRTADYQIAEFDGAVAKVRAAVKAGALPVPDAWVVQALSYLGEITRDPRYIDACFDMADAVLGTQFTPSNAAYPDYVGGFNNSRPPRSTPAGSRSEGLSQAYRLARVLGDDARADAYGLAVVRAARFMLHHQYVPDNSYYLPNPERALGGNRGSLIHNEIRIDYNQHAMSAVLIAVDAARRFAQRGVSLEETMRRDPF